MTSLPYLKFLCGVKFNASPQIDAVLKALFNQALFSQVLNALFLSYQAVLGGTDPVAAIKGGMTGQMVMCAKFWLPSDLINMYLVRAARRRRRPSAS